MAEKTGIAWCDSTWNLIWGCEEVSPGCDQCYAREWAKRFGVGWGHDAPRRTFGEKHWSEPRKWNRKAEAAGVPWRVFCGSMCDIAEKNATADTEREKLWPLIRQTPWLRWLLLTKRPARLVELVSQQEAAFGGVPFKVTYPNVWCMTTVEDQKRADSRMRELSKLQGRVSVLGLSVEPLLEPVTLYGLSCFDWVIVGGESKQPGHNPRPFYLEWAADLIRQCEETGTACFIKQAGSNVWTVNGETGQEIHVQLRHSHGGDPNEWPEWMRVRQFPPDPSPRPLIA